MAVSSFPSMSFGTPGNRSLANSRSTPFSTPGNGSENVWATPSHLSNAGGTPFATPGMGFGGANSSGSSSSDGSLNFGIGTPQSGGGWEAGSSPASNGTATPGPARSKGYRFAKYTHSPAKSSPLAISSFSPSPIRKPFDFPGTVDDDDDDMDDDYGAGNFGNHVPSSPLGRLSNPSFSAKSTGAFNIGAAEETETPLVARRRAQYKSMNGFASGGSSVARASSMRRTSGTPLPSLFASTPRMTDDPQKAFLKERFRKRVVQARTSKRKSAREQELNSEDGFFAADRGDDEMGDSDDEEGDDEDVLNDELFRRMMLNMERKRAHQIRVSYQNEVGGSDWDEDVTQWEHELESAPAPSSTPSPPTSTSTATPPRNNSSARMREYNRLIGRNVPTTVLPAVDKEQEDVAALAALEDDELEAYAEEYARLAAEEEGSHVHHNFVGAAEDTLAWLEGVPEEELFGAWNWSSDGEDIEME